MNQKFIAEMKIKLLAEKEKIERELGEVANVDPHSPNNYEAAFPNYGDEEEENAAEVGQFTTNLGLEKILTSSLRDVTGALDRIENGTYGICKYCKKVISEARLNARPASSACIECKQKLTKEK
jgi:DnaK suppressor protein